MPENFLKLIVHADDFGLTDGVNEGIRQAHMNGILTSTSIIANGSAFEHALGILEQIPTLDTGIHLTLVEEKPLNDQNQIQSLTGANGRFLGNAKIFMQRYLTGQIIISEVRKELEAQIKKVRDHGLKISHIDGHQHLHMLPNILKVTLELAKEYNIPAIRIPNENLSWYMFKHRRMYMRIIELMILKIFCMFSKKPGITVPDHFAGFYFGGNLKKENLLTLLNNIPRSGICEIMCHPGSDDSETPYSHWNYHGFEELKALTDPEVINYIQQENIQLIAYDGLINQ